MLAHAVTAIPCTGPHPAPPPGHSWACLMDEALDMAHKAAKAGEVPVGALVIATDGRILSRAHNAPIALNDPTAHAEILALRQAGAALGNYRLNGAVLVVTLEPCLMCVGALVHSRIAGLVYGAADTRTGAVISCTDGLALPLHNHTVWHMGGVRSEECAQLLQNFFGRTSS